ncbi:MAG: outer membrane beta-barrel protein [Prolixibacteraceae bacterium]
MKKLKKITLLIAALAFMANTGSAQALLGLKLGGNLSNVYDTEDENFTADTKLGLVTGVFATLPIGELLGIQPEFLFSQKGYKGSGNLLGSAYNYSRTSNFIDVPIFLAVKPMSMVTILAGPQFSFLLKETYKFENELLNIVDEQAFTNDNIRKNTLCFVGGVDINLDQLVIGARIGLDLQNNNGDGTSTTPRYKNIWYQGTIGYRLFSN